MERALETLGRYHIQGVLGEGGFATVYRAWDPGLGRMVALKALTPRAAENVETRRRFTREARTLAGLRHPGVVTVYDVGDVDGRPFFAMELIEGQTLAQISDERRGLPADQVIELIGSLASAVDYLHAAGLVHRDLKAANVMVDVAGRVVLMDFGVVREVDGPRRTAEGAVLGTPEAMSPEQARGEPAQAASDIYALGVLAYRLLSGRPPFTGEVREILEQHLRATPASLRLLRPDVPPALCAEVERAMSKQPRDRQATAGEFAAALRAALYPAPERRQPATAPIAVAPRAPVAAQAQPVPQAKTAKKASEVPAKRVAVVVVAALALAAAAAFGIYQTRGDARPPMTPTSAASATTSPAPTPVTRAPSITDVKVCDNVFACSEGEFQVREALAVCFSLVPGDPPRPLIVVAAGGANPPRDANDPAVIARSAPIPQTQSSTCYPVPVVAVKVEPGPYRVWVLDGATAVASSGFIARAQRFQIGQIVRVDTPDDCLRVRTQPSLSAPALACRGDGEHVRVLEGPVEADGNEWWKAAPWNAPDRDQGWMSGAYLVPSPDCERAPSDRTCSPAR